MNTSVMLDTGAGIRLDRELFAWLGSSGRSGSTAADTFPYDSLLAHLRAVGKHFLAPELLERLAGCRELAGWETGAGSSAAFLGRFLDVVLDKYDGRYDYQSYTALSLLRRPAAAEGVETGAQSSEDQGSEDQGSQAQGWEAQRRHRDRTVLLLLADLIDFERAAAEGHPADPREMLPESGVLDKRQRLAVRVMEAAALRVLAPGVVDPTAVAATPGRTPAGELAAAVLATATWQERLLLTASVQPVYVLHDEYLFLRVLQGFEATFTFMAGALEQAVRQLREGRAGDAAIAVATVADVLKESLPLFSLLATMQPESFQIFREYTDGASAIQSEGYKTFESLCSRPGQARLDSAAFTSVPRVREAVLNGRPTVQGSWQELIADHCPAEADRTSVLAAAQQLEAVHQRWKQTHYRLAVRMIGTRTGTGSTEGVPYLGAVIANRLFPAMAQQPTGVG